MSRIEKGQETKEDLEQLKGEVIKEIGSQRKGKPWCACSVIFLLFVFVFLCAIAWAIAATGLVAVPGFSQFAYQKPLPVREISTGTPVEDVIDEQVKSALTQRLQSTGGTLEDASVVITLEEKSVTASLRNLLAQSGDELLDSARAQVTISQERGFSFFLPLKNSPQETALQISLMANIQEGTLSLSPQFFSIGSLHIPKGLTVFFLQPFIHEKLAQLNSTLSTYLKITQLTFEQERVRVTGLFSVKIK